MNNIVISGTGSYVPKIKVYNDELIEHFSKKGLKVEGLMNHLGRRKRYFVDENENSLTMSVNAIKNCIEKNNIDLSGIELVVTCTDTPEYLIPSHSMNVVGEFKELSNVNEAFDLNSNCASIIVGLDVVSAYMKVKNINKALLIGVFCISPYALWDDTVVYGNLGDASCCLYLENIEDSIERGVLASKNVIDTEYIKYMHLPSCGMKKVPLQAVYPNEKRLEWIPFDTDFLANSWKNIIIELLSSRDLTVDDINYFIFSQLSDSANQETLKLLGVESDSGKYHFVGTEYAYTGNTCPAMVLDRMWDLYSKRGNYAIFITVGAGALLSGLLYKF